MGQSLINLLFVALVVASVTFTITTTSMFMWLRELVSPIHHKIEELIHCPYCLGHWATFIVLLILPHSFITDVLPAVNVGSKIFNFLFNAFAIMSIVALLHYVMLRAYKPVMEAMTMRMREKMQRQREEHYQEEEAIA
jgi:hypothetical protein